MKSVAQVMADRIAEADKALANPQLSKGARRRLIGRCKRCVSTSRQIIEQRRYVALAPILAALEAKIVSLHDGLTSS